jgi:hypothetical protein
MLPPQTPAEKITARLQHAATLGIPVLIPGSNEPRVRQASPPISPPAGSTSARPSVSDGLSDRGRLEHEREGGGSPGERRGVQRGTAFARLSRWLLRGGTT